MKRFIDALRRNDYDVEVGCFEIGCQEQAVELLI